MIASIATPRTLFATNNNDKVSPSTKSTRNTSTSADSFNCPLITVGTVTSVPSPGWPLGSFSRTSGTVPTINGITFVAPSPSKRRKWYTPARTSVDVSTDSLPAVSSGLIFNPSGNSPATSSGHFVQLPLTVISSVVPCCKPHGYRCVKVGAAACTVVQKSPMVINPAAMTDATRFVNKPLCAKSVID